MVLVVGLGAFSVLPQGPVDSGSHGEEVAEVSAGGSFAHIRHCCSQGVWLAFVRSPGSDMKRLHQAAFEGDTEKVKTFLADGDQIDSIEEGNLTALHFAAEKGNADIIQLLLEAFAYKDARDECGDTPLHVATFHGHLRAVNSLLDAYADKDALNQKQQSALHYAAQHGHEAVLEALVRASSNLELADEDAQTALHIAAELGHAAAVAQLLRAGARGNSPDVAGNTPLHLAACSGHAEVIHQLIGHRAGIHCRNQVDSRPLEPAWAGWPWRGSMKHGLSLKHADDERTCLVCGDTILGVLEDKWQEQQTPLFLAAQNGHVEAVQGLLHGGASCASADQEGCTALHLVALHGHVEVLHVLLKAGASVHAMDERAYTAREAALEKHRFGTAALLQADEEDGWLSAWLCARIQAEVVSALKGAREELQREADAEIAATRAKLEDEATRKVTDMVEEAKRRCREDVQCAQDEARQALETALQECREQGDAQRESLQRQLEIEWQSKLDAQQMAMFATLRDGGFGGAAEALQQLLEGARQLGVRPETEAHRIYDHEGARLDDQVDDHDRPELSQAEMDFRQLKGQLRQLADLPAVPVRECASPIASLLQQLKSHVDTSEDQTWRSVLVWRLSRDTLEPICEELGRIACTAPNLDQRCVSLGGKLLEMLRHPVEPGGPPQQLLEEYKDRLEEGLRRRGDLEKELQQRLQGGAEERARSKDLQEQIFGMDADLLRDGCSVCNVQISAGHEDVSVGCLPSLQGVVEAVQQQVSQWSLQYSASREQCIDLLQQLQVASNAPAASLKELEDEYQAQVAVYNRFLKQTQAESEEHRRVLCELVTQELHREGSLRQRCQRHAEESRVVLAQQRLVREVHGATIYLVAHA
ncbi:hypothetical protein CYMTET_56151 [Cymbomonas tetramitiformis]|uniref:Uncharacterized protein n=1 Tax=Cymbomonas tetramitiformis TaxID=36881 RepID=A0AAE0EM87_9CHLO|nr:hypothetical protein CYMTET_56151 [Cymbomonas tetramitiformis]